MQQILLTNIKELVQVRGDGEEVVSGSAMSNLPTIKNAWLLLKGDFIQDFGEMVTCPSGDFKIVDVKGKMILPTWVDCHTHIVFAASREEEFVMKIKGQTYEEIASAGGGILNSARKLRKHSEDELYQCAADRLIKLIDSIFISLKHPC